MPTPILDIIGLAAGVGGLCIAVYLQMVVRHAVPFRLISRFGLAGFALVAMSTEAILGSGYPLYEFLRLIGYTALIALEVTGLRSVQEYLVAAARVRELVKDEV